MARRTLVIVNPMSGGGATGRRWPQLRRALDARLQDWDNAFTLAPHDATRMAREAAMDGYAEVVVVGGDGTLHEAVNGLFEEDEEGLVTESPLNPGIVFTPIRFGTGGDFARHLGLSAQLPQAVDHVGAGRVTTVDVGLIGFRDHEGRGRRRIFLNIASFGLSGLVDAKVNASSKRLKGLSFLSATLRALAEYRPLAVQIGLDGDSFYRGPVVTAAVANGTTFGGGMKFARDARIDDGRLDLVVQTRAGTYEKLRVHQLYDGKLADWPSVHHGRGTVVTAGPLGDEPVLLDVDGEQVGVLPARFTVVPEVLRLRVPS